MAEPLFRTVDVKDRHGRVTGTKEVALYKGLLAKAHEEGLSVIRTDAIQFATDENARTAISKACITTSKGTFEAIGDAQGQIDAAWKEKPKDGIVRLISFARRPRLLEPSEHLLVHGTPR